ncbi:MAG TPA: class D sortase [Bryobacteraceae bacterium]
MSLAGFGAYQYYESKLAQSEAAQDWNTESQAEEPVPQQLPSPPEEKSPKWVPYYDPYKPGETVAKLRLPHLNTPLFVVEGTDQQELKKGPGHMPGTALPGVNGNCVIAGHRDTHFRALEGIQKGDEVEIETKYGRFRYQVESMNVVLPTDVSSLYPTKDAELHLITCYPFKFVGHAPKRMVIEARLLNNSDVALARP